MKVLDIIPQRCTLDHRHIVPLLLCVYSHKQVEVQCLFGGKTDHRGVDIYLPTASSASVAQCKIQHKTPLNFSSSVLYNCCITLTINAHMHRLWYITINPGVQLFRHMHGKINIFCPIYSDSPKYTKQLSRRGTCGEGALVV